MNQQIEPKKVFLARYRATHLHEKPEVYIFFYEDKDEYTKNSVYRHSWNKDTMRAIDFIARQFPQGAILGIASDVLLNRFVNPSVLEKVSVEEFQEVLQMLEERIKLRKEKSVIPLMVP